MRWRDGMAALTLRAVLDQHGRGVFSFDGRTVPPVIRAAPGDTLRLRYANDLPPHSQAPCALGPCMNMSNLHFHGLAVSPRAPQDDVLSMLAAPGQTLDYAVTIPREHPPELYWYHPHPHGESQRQVLDGMSGALVIDGIDRYAPGVRDLRERVLVVRERDLAHDPQAAALLTRVQTPPTPCGAASGQPDRIFTVNGALRPAIAIAPGERQFWRIVNASADRYVDVQVDGQPLDVVALDGVPFAYHDPRATRLRRTDHVVVPPAGRLEAIVAGPPAGARARVRTRCVDTGPDGDPNPEMVLAHVVSDASLPSATAPPTDRAAVHRPAAPADLKASAPQFVVTFTEDKEGFYINHRKFAADAAPMTRVQVGINVPVGGSVDLIMDFTDPAIRGMSVFHCHLLNHEDKGMMAKILFE